MIYVFGAYVVVSGLIVAYLVWALLEKDQRSREERQELEDKVLALASPLALQQAMLARTQGEAEEGVVEYIDERKEYELQRKG